MFVKAPNKVSLRRIEAVEKGVASPGFTMDACPTVTHGVTRSSLLQLPELQRMPGEYWHLQGLAGCVACSGGVQ